MYITVFLFILGLILIIKGGNWFVDAAIGIAQLSGLSEVLIGMSIVSLATTLPEITISVMAATNGHTTMSVGNAIGSMICNIGMVLSLPLLFMSGKINDKNFTIKASILLLALVILYVVARDGVIDKSNSFILIAILLMFIGVNVHEAFHSIHLQQRHVSEDISRKEKKKLLLFFILGIISIFWGSRLLIDNGIIIADYLGVPEAVISLTFIAFGTSLPEFTTGITSLVKKKPAIGLGNIIGANILNICLVIGLSGLFSPLEVIPQNISFDLPIVIVLTLVLIVPAVIKKRTYFLQGLLFIIIYIFFISMTFKNS